MPEMWPHESGGEVTAFLAAGLGWVHWRRSTAVCGPDEKESAAVRRRYLENITAMITGHVTIISDYIIRVLVEKDLVRKHAGVWFQAASHTSQFRCKTRLHEVTWHRWGRSLFKTEACLMSCLMLRGIFSPLDSDLELKLDCSLLISARGAGLSRAPPSDSVAQLHSIKLTQIRSGRSLKVKTHEYELSNIH